MEYYYSHRVTGSKVETIIGNRVDGQILMPETPRKLRLKSANRRPSDHDSVPGPGHQLST